jgi:hypothetical protein
LARHEYAERHTTPAIVARGALEIRQLGGLHAGNDKRILRQGVATDERAAAVREQGVGFEGRTRILVELAFEPLDLERPAEPLRDGLSQHDVEAPVRRATMMYRERRQVLVEADLQNIVGAGCRDRGHRHKQSRRTGCRQPTPHRSLRLDM